MVKQLVYEDFDYLQGHVVEEQVVGEVGVEQAVAGAPSMLVVAQM